MSGVELDILVQGSDEVNVEEVKEFIEFCDNAKLVLVHSSLKEDVVNLGFFQEFIEEIKTPLLGVGVSGSYTPQSGYVEDAVAFGVLSGDFEAEVFQERINYDDIEETAGKIKPKLKGGNTTIVHSSNSYYHLNYVDMILRRLQNEYPKLQIIGGNSAPEPFITTKKGVFEDHIGFAILKNVDNRFFLDSGGRFQKDTWEFEVTRSDERHIYELNRENAVTEYCKLQHFRPYFVNMLTRMVLRRDLAKILKKLSETNKDMYEVVMKATIKTLGARLKKEATEPLFPLNLDEEKSSFLNQNYKPRGTKLNPVTNEYDDTIQVYENLAKEHPGRRNMLVFECGYRPFWLNFDYQAVEKEYEKLDCNYLASYYWGEYGNYIPTPKENQNIVHAGTIKALIFK